MQTLNQHTLSGDARRAWEAVRKAPVTVLQIGEGKFLRGFVDWMFQVCRDKGLYEGSIAVMQPRPIDLDMIETLAAQDGLYTLVLRGLQGGKPVEEKRIISVFSKVFNPYVDWSRFVQLAKSPDLKVVISNTTEAGLVYRPEQNTGGPIESTPGKIAFLLHERYQAFGGAEDRGLVFLPCELLDGNGDILRELVLRYADDWGYSEAFKDWVKRCNRFLNNLVDRIVTGCPDEEQAERWFAEWGYRDGLLNTAEPYHLWAIEAEPEMDDLLPFRRAGLNVQWTDNLALYQKRKVRLLNGAHTWMAPLGLVNGIEYVRQFIEHPVLGKRVREVVMNELVPTLPYPKADLKSYAESVFERFANPYIKHRLADIALNSISKFNARLLPALAHYAERNEPIPAGLVLGLTGLLRYYKVERRDDGRYVGTTLAGVPYEVRDNEETLARIAGIWRGFAEGETLPDVLRKLLADEALWGRKMSDWAGLAEAVADAWGKLDLGVGQ